MKRVLALLFIMVLTVSLSSCVNSSRDAEVVPDQNEAAQADVASVMADTENETEERSMAEYYTTNTKIEDVINDPVFGDYGRLIFPVDSGYYGGSTLGNLSLAWYQINSMVNDYSDTFHLANNEVDGNVSYRIYEGGTHGPEASNQYTFNALLWFWNN